MGMVVLVLVVDPTIESAQAPKTSFGALPPVLDFPALKSLEGILSESQRVQLVVGVNQMRKAYSARVLTHLRLVRLAPDWLSRADVTSADNRKRLLAGEVVIALETRVDFEGGGAAGRPEDGPVEIALKSALGKSIARIDCLTAAASDHDADAFLARRDELGHWLQIHEALFNLNSSHTAFSKFPVLTWCENNGLSLMAQSYGMVQSELAAALQSACAQKLRHEPFADAMAREIGYLDTLLTWSSAHRGRQDAVASRRDSLQRFVDKLKKTIGPPPQAIAPPQTRKPVREKLSAERVSGRLGDRQMLEAAIMFELEPAYEVFLNRLYLKPLLCVAGLIGEIGMRKKVARISTPVVAGGLIAMVEGRGFANEEMSDVDGSEAPEDEIGAHQAMLETILDGFGLSISEMAEGGREFLSTNESVSLAPCAGLPQFFLDSRH